MYYDEEQALFLCVTTEIKSHISDYYKLLIIEPIKKELDKMKASKDENNFNLIEKLDELRLKYTSVTKKNRIINDIINDQKEFNDFDESQQKPYLLPVMNKKCLNLKTGEIIERKRNHYFTFEVKANMDHEIKDTSRAYEFFLNFMSGNIEKLEFLKQILGAMLTGYSMKYVFSFYGSKGDNGKSVVINKIMRHALGEYHRTISKDIILKRSNKSSKGPSPELIELKNGRLGVLSEINEGEHIDEEAYKLLSSKDDFIEARNHHEKKMTKFINTCKPVFLLNKPFFLDSSDNATLNRIINIHCEAEFKENPSKGQYKRDEELINYLISPEGLAEVLSFLCEGSKIIIKNKMIFKGEILEQQKKLFLDLIDPVEGYVKNHIKFNKDLNEFISNRQISENFNLFYNDSKTKLKFKILKDKLFDILKKQARSVKIRGFFGYKGLKLIEYGFIEEEEEEEEEHDDELKTALNKNQEQALQIEELKKALESLKIENEKMRAFIDGKNKNKNDKKEELSEELSEEEELSEDEELSDEELSDEDERIISPEKLDIPINNKINNSSSQITQKQQEIMVKKLIVTL